MTRQEGGTTVRAARKLILSLVFMSAGATFAEQCADLIGKVSKNADKCLATKDYDQRYSCVQVAADNLGYTNSVYKQCQAQMKSLATKYIALEAQAWPGQNSAFAAGTSAAAISQSSKKEMSQPSASTKAKSEITGERTEQTLGTSAALIEKKSPPMIEKTALEVESSDQVTVPVTNSRAPSSDCGTLLSEIAKQATQCLGMTADSARQTCGNKVGDYAQAHGANHCQNQIDTLHDQFIRKEKQKYKNSVL
jgi:hypothetical protein